MQPYDPKYPNLRVLTLKQGADVKRLLLLLSGFCQSSDLAKLEDESHLPERRPQLPLPASRIAQLVLPDNNRSLEIQSVIVESNYVDRDSNIAYARLHARAFRDYPRRTIRLHFLQSEFTSCKQLLDAEELRNSYVGFCVLPATQPGIIGRTVLPPPKGDSSWFFVPGQVEFAANISGTQVHPRGTAFIQQDGRMAACASASTWMSTVMTAKQFRLKVPLPSIADITQLATKYSLPPTWGGSKRGLKVEQILWALQEIGYEPLSHELFHPQQATELIYHYVESGIPPIMVIRLPDKGWHAITAVGHTYDPGIDPQAKISQGICSSSIWCPHFLAHDDQMGPYLKIAIDSPNARSKKKPTLRVDGTDTLLQQDKEKIANWYRDASLFYVIAPFPPRHALRPEGADAKGKAILEVTYKLYSSFLARVNAAFPANPIYRTYFMASNEFRSRFPQEATLANNKKVHRLPSELAHWYRGLVYPRYVWVTELCGLNNRTGRSPEDIHVVADVTIDPTSDPHVLDFVTLHLPHLFFIMPPSVTSVADALRTPVVIQDDRPYQPLLRLESAQMPIR